jgi:hypothetical protein
MVKMGLPGCRIGKVPLGMRRELCDDRPGERARAPEMVKMGLPGCRIGKVPLGMRRELCDDRPGERM